MSDSIDLGKFGSALLRNWKTIGVIITILGFSFGWGWTLADMGHKHNDVVRDVEALKGQASGMQTELRTMRESMIRTETILERIERKLP